MANMFNYRTNNHQEVLKGEIHLYISYLHHDYFFIFLKHKLNFRNIFIK